MLCKVEFANSASLLNHIKGLDHVSALIAGYIKICWLFCVSSSRSADWTKREVVEYAFTD